MDALEKAEQWMARALSESSYVTGEAYGVVKELTSDLTSAKEEIERLKEQLGIWRTDERARCLDVSKLFDELTAERKETERLKRAVESVRSHYRDAFRNTIVTPVTASVMFDMLTVALQPPQQEEQ